MASAAGQSVGYGRTGVQARGVAGRAPVLSTVSIIENPLAVQDAHLGKAVEEEARGVLGSQDLGRVEVRFRVCGDEAEGLRFICKVESPAPTDLHQEGSQWRWWSPLMETADEFRAALLDAVEIRRQRLSSQSLTA